MLDSYIRHWDSVRSQEIALKGLGHSYALDHLQGPLQGGSWVPCGGPYGQASLTRTFCTGALTGTDLTRTAVSGPSTPDGALAAGAPARGKGPVRSPVKAKERVQKQPNPQ